MNRENVVIGKNDIHTKLM